MACGGTGTNPVADNSSDSAATHAEDSASATTDTIVYEHDYIVHETIDKAVGGIKSLGTELEALK